MNGTQVKIGELHKGAVFLAEVKRRLFSEGFTVAIPEPDVGDDLWTADVGVSNPAENTEGDGVLIQPRLLRCQLKSAHAIQMEGGDEKYTVNLTKSSSARLKQAFYYVVGLYDARLEGSQFHMCCFPSEFLWKLVDEGKVRSTRSQSRRMLDFFLSSSADYPRYTLRLRYPAEEGKKRGKGPRADMGEFFLSHDGTFRAAFEHCGHWNGEIRSARARSRKGNSQ